jgi:hypothetical protein
LTWHVVFEPPAQAEIAQAFEWYEQRSYGLGGDFLRVIGAARGAVEAQPGSFSEYARQISENLVTPVSLRAAL